MKLDQAFGIEPRILDLRAYRASLLAANLANADTPGYQARDIDFQAALDQTMQTGFALAPRVTNPGHLSGSPSGAPFGVRPLYRTPLQASLDGNTVNTQREQAAFLDNAIRYQASLTFLGGRINQLRLAISGGR